VYARKAKEVDGSLECPHLQTSVVVARIKEVAKKKSGEFQEKREHDQLTEALGNPEHRGRVRGVSSNMSWKVGLHKFKEGHHADAPIYIIPPAFHGRNSRYIFPRRAN